MRVRVCVREGEGGREGRWGGGALSRTNCTAMLEKAFSPEKAEVSNENAGRGAIDAPSLATALVKKGSFAALMAPTKERTSKHAGGMVCLVPLRLRLRVQLGLR